MVADLPLSGRKVLVTRPQQQAKTLADLIIQQGGEAISFPVIQINKLDIGSETNNSLFDTDIIIFVSRNAVQYFFTDAARELAESTTVVAVGKGTAAVLHQHGITHASHPTHAIGSEGVLMMPELENVSGNKIVIVRGRGGRELLADTLTARGAKISYIEVYERVLARLTDEQCKQALTADTLVCTSVAGVTNLPLLLKQDIDRVLLTPLIVLSERIKHHALSLGFKAVMVSADANDYAIKQRLVEMER